MNNKEIMNIKLIGNLEKFTPVLSFLETNSLRSDGAKLLIPKIIEILTLLNIQEVLKENPIDFNNQALQRRLYIEQKIPIDLFLVNKVIYALTPSNWNILLKCFSLIEIKRILNINWGRASSLEKILRVFNQNLKELHRSQITLTLESQSNLELYYTHEEIKALYSKINPYNDAQWLDNFKFELRHCVFFKIEYLKNTFDKNLSLSKELYEIMRKQFTPWHDFLITLNIPSYMTSEVGKTLQYKIAQNNLHESQKPLVTQLSIFKQFNTHQHQYKLELIEEEELSFAQWLDSDECSKVLEALSRC